MMSLMLRRRGSQPPTSERFAVGDLVVQTRLSVVRLDAELQRLNATVAVVLQNELAEGLSPEAAAEDALAEVQMADRRNARTWQAR